MARRLVSNLKEEYLSCSICLEQYQMPKTLPCDHIFCEKCLISHVKRTITKNAANVVVTCPICRQKITLKQKESFDVESWVKDLPTDSLVGSLMQTLKKHERDPKGPSPLPKLCKQHGGKPCEAFCFTHVHVMCWECAAREHRSCNVDSADKAKHVIKPDLESLKKTVENHLTRARELSKEDETFKVNKTKVLSDIQEFESRLDNVFTSAKHQISLLKCEVETISSKYQDERKNFYEVVTSLLESHCSLEILLNEQKVSTLFDTLEDVKKDTERALKKFKQIENESNCIEERRIEFIPDERVQNFLAVYSGIGFVDSNVPGSSQLSLGTLSSISAPASLSHILNRSKSVGDTKSKQK